MALGKALELAQPGDVLLVLAEPQMALPVIMAFQQAREAEGPTGL